MNTENIKYRPYIDGLRAIAVIAVIIFHLNPDFFPGGYLGVDIFFVISGFVISQSLYKNYLKTGRVDVAQFYIRRFWRLYPALITMVSATTLAYVFFGFVWDTNLLIKSSITSIFAVSNLYYLHQAENYFHQDLINPLLHTWSLGIEEQFYIVYPLLLLAVLFVFMKWHIRRVHIPLLFLGGSTGLYALFYFNQGSIFGDFYFPTARFWELGIGCALFFFSLDFGPKRYLRFIAGPALASLCAIMIFQQHIANLSIELLATVIATALLILSGLHAKSIVVRTLEYPKIVFVGTVSYSLYLWHLPVIYFCNLYLSGITYYVFSVFFTVCLALVSYTYVEKRFRHGLQNTQILKRVSYIFLGVSTVFVVYIFVVSVPSFAKQINAHLNAFSESVDSVNYIESQFNLAERIQPNFSLNGVSTGEYCGEVSKGYSLTNEGLRSECLVDKGNDSLLYLTGDSHASHLIPMLDQTQLGHDLYFSRFSRGAIVNPEELPVDTDESIQERKEELQALSSRYNTIFYMTSLFLSNGSSDPEAMQNNLEKYIEELSPYATMIMVAPTPVFSSGPESCVILGVHCVVGKEQDQQRRAVALKVQNALAEKYTNVYMYDPYETICPDEACMIYDAETDFLLYMDDDHLSVEASESLSRDFDSWFTQTFDRQG